MATENEKGGVDAIVDSLEKVYERKSFGKFADKYRGLASTMAGELKTLREMLGNLENVDSEKHSYKDKDAIESFKAKLQTARDELEKVGEEGPRGWVATNGAELKAFHEAHDAYERATSAIEKFLAGELKWSPDNSKEKYGASPELRKAYDKAVEATGSVNKVMNGIFGKLNIEGWEKTLQHNLNFMDDAVMKNRSAVVFGRGAGVLVGAVAAIDAGIRSQDSNGEKRGVLTRWLELATGLGVAGFSAFSGAAR